jgi:hypothetical protein
LPFAFTGKIVKVTIELKPKPSELKAAGTGAKAA